MKRKNMVYMKVTTDKYELPIAVADSPKELAELTGDNPRRISSYICKGIGTFYRVEIEDKTT